MFLCHSQTENKGISLLFYPAGLMDKGTLMDRGISQLFYLTGLMVRGDEVVYSINVINDSLTIKTNHRAGNKEYIGKLTNNQYLEIKNLISALTQKYDWPDFHALGAWGCMLKIDNQVYFKTNYFSFDSTRFERQGLRSTPEEIKQLIDYIVGLSPIPIKLFSFS
jgi:hypothetical protein